MIAVQMTVAVQPAIHMAVVAKFEIGGEPYEGEHEFTPSDEIQTAQTKNKVLLDNIVIHPIPSNYGRIGWDGSILTVS